ncbi:MAG: hypothetical protein ACRD1E_01825 [Terriglobales bacterium]
MRLDDVKPNFDVFSLGKLLWAMVSPKTRMRLWYHDAPEFSLKTAFPNDGLPGLPAPTWPWAAD